LGRVELFHQQGSANPGHFHFEKGEFAEPIESVFRIIFFSGKSREESASRWFVTTGSVRNAVLPGDSRDIKSHLLIVACRTPHPRANIPPALCLAQFNKITMPRLYDFQKGENSDQMKASRKSAKHWP
jgi:hypothetical protein